MAPPAKKHKGPSAYMIFSEEHRPDVQAKLRAEAADGKVPITAIAKALGERWKSLSEQEQHVYREKAQQRAAEAAAAAEANEDDASAEQQADAAEVAAAAPAPASLPRHLVKKIMLADDDVQRVAADAQWLVAEAAALFLQQLAVKAAAAAAAKKRKTIQLVDFEHVVRCDKRLVEAGLKDVAQNKRFFELHGVAQPAGGSKTKQQGKAAAALAGRHKAMQTTGNKENQDQQQQHEDDHDNADKENAAEPAAGGEAVAGEQMTDEQRIALEEQKRKRIEAAAKARAAKAAEKKVTKELEAAKGYHKISTFFPSNKPDAFV